MSTRFTDDFFKGRKNNPNETLMNPEYTHFNSAPKFKEKRNQKDPSVLFDLET